MTVDLSPEALDRLEPILRALVRNEQYGRVSPDLALDLVAEVRRLRAEREGIERLRANRYTIEALVVAAFVETIRAFDRRALRAKRDAAVRHAASLERAIAEGASHLHDSESVRVAHQTRIVDLERAIVDMKFTACAALMWACDSNPDAGAVRAVKALAAEVERARAERDARPDIAPAAAARYIRARDFGDPVGGMLAYEALREHAEKGEGQ